MALITKTRGQTRLILARQLEQEAFYSGTATGGTATTSVAGGIAGGKYINDHFTNGELTNQTRGWSTTVTRFDRSTGTFTHPSQALPTQSGDTLEWHSSSAWTVQQYNDALDLAVAAAGHADAIVPKFAQTLSFERGRSQYKVPSDFRGINRISVDARPSYVVGTPSHSWDTLTGLKDTSDHTKLAQSFQVTSSNPTFVVGDIYLLLSRNAFQSDLPTGSVTALIRSDNAGVPSTTSLWSKSVNAATIDTEPTYVRFAAGDQAPPAVLQTNTTYWIELAGGWSVDGISYVSWANDSADSGYASGQAMAHNGVSWGAIDGDFVFTIRAASRQVLVPLHGPYSGPAAHWRVVQDTTRYIQLTESGLAYIEEDLGLDSVALHIEGKGSPALPTSDSSTLEIPFDYAVAWAGLFLSGTNEAWFSRQSNGKSLLSLWSSAIEKLEPKLRTHFGDGYVEVDAF